MKILGISAFYHDSAAALLIDGKIVAAVQEERFTRKKHDSSFPKNAIIYCLQDNKISITDVDYIVFYDKPLIKFERLLETYLSYAPKGIRSFLSSMPVWLKEKLFLKDLLRKGLATLGDVKTKDIPKLMFTEHHQSHAASAYFPSPFEESAILCIDGVGEWATTSCWYGKGNKLDPVWQINFPHSLGLLYSAFTYYTGFKVNSGEYKLMGLAPYGEPIYVDLIYKHLIEVKDDGSFRLDMKYFNFAVGLTMTNNNFNQLFGKQPRKPESEISQVEMDLAKSIQVVTEDIVLKLARNIKEELKVENLCLAGGVALNCVANGKLLKEKIFKDIWIQPAAGDAGGAIGAAFSIWNEYLDNEKILTSGIDQIKGSYLGPQFNNDQIVTYLNEAGAKYTELADPQLLPKLSEILANELVVGWFQGRMEFGPRALGGRSIIGDPRSKKMQSIMNLKIKYRESFRPFAPSVKAESASNWFNIDSKSPYMLLVADVKKDKQISMTEDQIQLFGIDKLNIPRSEIPAVTHVDYSARIQTVHKETNPRFWNLLDQFEQLTDCPVLINTSFNVRGEPIVCTPEDAYRCFMRTEMDYLVMENIILSKKDQLKWEQNDSWKNEFELD
jgi:carbamoyltransferase